jgi:hypothetical protein
MVLEELLRARFGLDLKVDLAKPIEPALARVLGRHTHHYADSEVPDGVLACSSTQPCQPRRNRTFSRSPSSKLRMPRSAEPSLGIASMPQIAASPAFLVFCGGARPANLHPLRRSHRSRLPPDQRDPKSTAKRCGSAQVARRCVPRRRIMRGLSGRATTHEHASAADGDDTHRWVSR